MNFSESRYLSLQVNENSVTISQQEEGGLRTNPTTLQFDIIDWRLGDKLLEVQKNNDLLKDLWKNNSKAVIETRDECKLLADRNASIVDFNNLGSFLHEYKLLAVVSMVNLFMASPDKTLYLLKEFSVDG